MLVRKIYIKSLTNKENLFIMYVLLVNHGRLSKMERATVSEISDMTGLHANTIRRYADRGLIESKRDFRGWRFFPEPMKTVKKIKALLDGDTQLEK